MSDGPSYAQNLTRIAITVFSLREFPEKPAMFGRRPYSSGCVGQNSRLG